MRCREFEQRLNAVLDERSDPVADEMLCAHAQTCAPCRMLLDGQQLLFSALPQSASRSPPPGFARRVVAEAAICFAPARPQPTSKIMLAAATLLVSAAMALLALGIVWYARTRQPADPGAEQLLAGEQKQKPRSQRFGGDGTVAIAQPWNGGDWLVEAPRLPDHLRESLDELADTIPESLQRYGEMERLAPGIRPLRLSLALLWDTLFRALPGVPDSTPLREPSAPQPTGRSSSGGTVLWRLA
jgi:hypothetical protein